MAKVSMAKVSTAKERPPRPDRGPSACSEVVIFPHTNIRVLRRMWGLPEYGPITAGPDGRAIGVLGEDGLAG